MIYELRQYEIKPGRMADTHRMFKEVCIPAFEELGIQPLGFWEPFEPDGQTFVYLLGFESAEARERIWEAFKIHPGWLAEKASWSDGSPYEKVTPTVLAATEYSRMR